MIQFNLLPDVKLEYIRAQRTKRLVMLISLLVSAAALGIFILMFTLVNVSQKTHLGNLQKDIDSSKKELQDQSDIAKILTIQNQLNTLPSLHDKKLVTSRTLPFMQQLTPQGVTISKLDFKWEEGIASAEGSADSVALVNTFVDTIKFAKADITINSDESALPEKKIPFNTVVLQTFTVGKEEAGKKPVTYTINFKFDPLMFSSDYDVVLTVNGDKKQ